MTQAQAVEVEGGPSGGSESEQWETPSLGWTSACSPGREPHRQPVRCRRAVFC